jgi:hypothetical protein
MLKAARMPGITTLLSVTVSVPAGCFTTVLDFMTDPLCEEDVVLGIDWVDKCLSNGLSALHDSFPLYQAGLLILPRRIIIR